MELNEIYKPINKDEMEKCSNCHRSFLKGRLLLHQKSCKSSKPMKMLNLKSRDQNSNQKISQQFSTDKKRSKVYLNNSNDNTD